MHEGLPDTPEEGSESIPTTEEVRSVFEQLVGEKKYEDVRKLEDEHGLYLWDIIISGENGNTEYSYMRSGRYPEGQAEDTAINITFFDKAGVPFHGYSIAKRIKGGVEANSLES